MCTSHVHLYVGTCVGLLALLIKAEYSLVVQLVRAIDPAGREFACLNVVRKT